MRVIRTISALCLAATFAACSGKSAATPVTPTPTPPVETPPVVQPFAQTVTGNVLAFGFNPHVLTTARAGTLKAVLTWPNGAIDLDLYLTNAACDTYPPLHCTTIATSETATGTTETISRTVASGEQYKFWVDNFSTTLPSDYTIQLTIQ